MQRSIVDFPEPLAPMTQTISPRFTAIEGEGDAIERNLVVAETVVDVAHLEAADDVAFFFDDSLGKIAAQELADIDANGVAVGERSGRPNRDIADHDRAVRFQDFEDADAFVVVAGNFQKHIAGRAR